MPSRAAPEGKEVSMERVRAHAASRGLIMLPPWLCMVLLLILAVILHHNWPGIWGLMVGVAGLALVALSRHLTHRHSHFGRYLSPVTALLVTAWLTATDLLGVTHALAGFWAIGGIMLCSAWNMWLASREGDGGEGFSGFIQGAERAGFQGLKIFGVKLHERKREAIVKLTPGELVHDDLSKRTGYIESGAGLPPGAITTAPHPDNASWAHVTLSDPRVLRTPIPYPFAGKGSRPGASIAEPLQIGMYQDAEPVDYTVVGHHKQEMGASGAGKTQGGCWSEIGETVTRRDAAVLAIDITKGEQFLGPLRPALHRFEPEDDGALDLLAGFHRARKARTNYLGRWQLSKWERGCGLTHVTFWLEECPDIFELADKADKLEELMSDIKAARSAGMRIVLSLQRSDFTQIPTLARGQLAKMCFGVEDEQDAKFGLSVRQYSRDCSPELWGTRQPGMAYLDAPTIPDKYLAMPLRTWFWGENSDLVAAHAAQFPASARPLDEITLAALEGREPAYQPHPDGRTVPPAIHPDAQPPSRPLIQPAMAGAAATHPGRPAVRLVHPPEEDQMSRNSPPIHDDHMPDPARWADDDDSDEELPPTTDEDLTYDPDSDFGKFQFDDPAPTGQRMPPEEAQAAFMEMMTRWAAKGRQDFGIADLVGSDILRQVQRERTWLYNALEAAEKAGILRRVPGFPIRWKFIRAS